MQACVGEGPLNGRLPWGSSPSSSATVLLLQRAEEAKQRKETTPNGNRLHRASDNPPTKASPCAKLNAKGASFRETPINNPLQDISLLAWRCLRLSLPTMTRNPLPRQRLCLLFLRF